MGNAQCCSDDLIYLRPWTANDISKVLDNLRVRRPATAVNRARFLELFGARSIQEATKIFRSLDTDFDEKVDTFEVLMILVFWSSASWDEKVGLAFQCFDFNRKGYLRFLEVALMVTLTARAVQKFVLVDHEMADEVFLRSLASEAFSGVGGGDDGKDKDGLDFEAFQAWVEGSDRWQKLRAHLVDAQETQGEPLETDLPVGRQLQQLDNRMRELSNRLEHLSSQASQVDAREVERSDQQQHHFLVLRKRLSALLGKLACTSETLRAELAELRVSLNQEIAASGPARLVEPGTVLQHDKLFAEAIVLQRRCDEDTSTAEDLVKRVLELTYGSQNALPVCDLLPADASRRASQTSTPMRPAGTEEEREPRILDREHKRTRGIKQVRLCECGWALMGDSIFCHKCGKRQPDADLLPSAWSGGIGTQGSVDLGAPASSAGAARAPSAGAESGVSVGSDSLVYVAFADFEPPPSHETQMMSLKLGDEIIATGRDEGGWWYGRKADGSEEGWFPPSYVQPQAQLPRQ